METSGMAEAFLDIYAEDELARETKHVIGERKSMIQIKSQQELVVSEFLKHVNRMSEELRRSGPDEPGQKGLLGG
jgi:hypothetical protein